jgi:hypothetical protein
MALVFPAIKPTARSFKQGAFPTKVYRALSGATAKRSFGNRAYGFELQLQFENVRDGIAALIFKHYSDTSGGFERFTLPDEVFAGMSNELRGYANPTATIRWEYAGPPDVSSARGGISNVRVSLVGELIS